MRRREFLSAPLWAARLPWKAGVAKVRITPERLLWLAGFGARTKPAEGTLTELYAKALALEDQQGGRAVLVTTDLVGLPAVVAQHIADAAAQQYRLARDRLILNSSHTHSGPVLRDPIEIGYDEKITAAQWADIDAYTRELEGKVVAAIGAALEDLRPAQLGFAHSAAKFAVNRRQKTDRGFINGSNPDGPVDHDVPVLTARAPDGALRAVVFGYACHNTSLTATNYLYAGDYAGFAQGLLEQRLPGATAMFVAGCGADANALPRGTVELSRKYGEMLAAAVEKALGDAAPQVRGPLRCAFELCPVRFAPPSRAELEARLKHNSADWRRHAQEMLKLLDRDGRLPADYPYPLQVWQFGRDLTLIALAGEPVVDYALRLKRELGAGTLWVSGYNNDVFTYVPSLRVLKEGGYEGGDAMIWSRLPGPFAPDIEETIIGRLRAMLKRVR